MADRMSAGNEWARGWPVLIAAVGGVMLSTVHGYSLGVMIGPLEKEYGWSRAGISSGMFILAIMGLFAAPMVGVMVDRYGPRRIAILGVVCCCTSLGLLSTAGANIATWLGLWVLMSASAMLVAPIVWTAAVSSLFVKSRGLALAIALCGTGLGGAIVPFLTAKLVDHYGWRGGYIGLALIYAAIVLPLTLFLFTSVADRHRTRKAGDSSAEAPQALSGATAREAMRSPRFVKLVGASLFAGIAACAFTTSSVPILISQGFTRDAAAAIAGIVGIGAIAGRLFGGYLLDRMDANKVASACVAIPIVTAAILIARPGSTPAATLAFGLLGLALGTELDACAYLAARHFGMKSFGVIFGVINGMLLFGSGVTPLVCNAVYDATKSYVPVLWCLMPISAIASLLFLFLGGYSRAAEREEPVLAPV